MLCSVHYEVRLLGVVPEFWELRPLQSPPSKDSPQICFSSMTFSKNKNVESDGKVVIDHMRIYGKPTLEKCRSIIAEITGLPHKDVILYAYCDD